MVVSPDAWLGANLERPVFGVSARPESPFVADELRAHGEQHPGAMYFAKVDTTDVRSGRVLSDAGFFVVDVSLTLAWRGEPAALTAGDWSVGEPTDAQSAAVLEIARTCFRFSRFHLDPLVPREKADQIKHDWILNYLRKKRGDHLFVASRDGRPAGFLAAIRTPTAAVIDLMGVGVDARRQGVGRALVNAFISRYRDTGVSLEVGTQAANIPSLRLYEASGFSLVKSQYVFHKHCK